MSRILWDQVGERRYEHGCDRGVLFIPTAGVYGEGFGWNGLVSVTESPSGGESNKTYADNSVYLNLISLEEFGGTIEAYTYPDEFEACDGSAEVTPGVTVGQQDRQTFGLAWRTKVGTDENPSAGYKLHLVWGALASPSEKAHNTINDTPEAATFSWEITTTPVGVTIDGDEKMTAKMTIDSTKVDSDALATLEDFLYGTVGTDPSLPSPDEVIAIFDGTVTEVLLTGASAPSYNSGTYIITIPTVTGVTFKIAGVTVTGAQPALTSGQTKVVTAHLAEGYAFATGSDSDWSFSY